MDLLGSLTQGDERGMRDWDRIGQGKMGDV